MKFFLLFIFFLTTIILTGFDLKAEGPHVFIEAPGNRTEFCIGDKTVLIGKCVYGSDSFAKHQWESSTENLIVETRDYFAFIELKEAGEHLITYYAWNEKGDKGSESITLTVYNNPQKDLIVSYGFFTRLFRRQTPAVIEVKYADPGHKYQWFHNNNEIEDATKKQFKAVEQGRYHVVITSSNGCKVYSQSVHIE